MSRRVDEAEGDEMWAPVGHKNAQRWLGHAIDPHLGQGLADVGGRRQAQGLLTLPALLEPCGITRYDTDYGGAYPGHLTTDEPHPGQRPPSKSRGSS
jgi:IS1 family transposase